MAKVMIMFFALFALNVALAWILIWTRRDTPLRHLAIPYVVGVIPLFAFVATETLGRHKPVQVAWYELNNNPKVIAYKAIPNEAIYLYLDIGEQEPRAISIPWSASKARQLAEAMDGEKGGAIMKRDGKWLPQGRIEYAPPQEPLPPKPEQPRGDYLEHEL